MVFYVWKRAGLAGMFTAILPFGLGPEIIKRYYSDQVPNYSQSVGPKLIFWGLSIALTSIVIYASSRYFKEADKSYRERLMLDHIYYVPLLLWPFLLLISCALSIYYQWPY